MASQAFRSSLNSASSGTSPGTLATSVTGSAVSKAEPHSRPSASIREGTIAIACSAEDANTGNDDITIASDTPPYRPRSTPTFPRSTRPPPR